MAGRACALRLTEHARGGACFPGADRRDDGGGYLLPTVARRLDRVRVVGGLRADQAQIDDVDRPFERDPQDDVVEDHQRDARERRPRSLQVALVDGADGGPAAQLPHALQRRDIGSGERVDAPPEQRQRLGRRRDRNVQEIAVRERVVPPDRHHHVGHFLLDLGDLRTEIVRRASVDREQRRRPPGRQRRPHVRDHVGCAVRVRGVVEDRVAQKRDVWSSAWLVAQISARPPYLVTARDRSQKKSAPRCRSGGAPIVVQIQQPVTRRHAMKVMMLGFVKTKQTEAGQFPPTEEALLAMHKFNEELRNAGVLLDLAGLTPTSRGVRVRYSGSKRTVIDGPFAEAKEVIGGYTLLEVKTFAEAVEWAKRAPFGMGVQDGEELEVELRPLFDPADFDVPGEAEERAKRSRA